MSLSKWAFAEVLAGVALTGIAVKIARPLLVATVGAGFKATDLAREQWGKAREGLGNVVADARAAEVSRLEAHVDTLKAKLSEKGKPTSSSKK